MHYIIQYLNEQKYISIPSFKNKTGMGDNYEKNC
jgi:hypothetical protein